MKCETLRNYILSIISVGGHFQVLSGVVQPSKGNGELRVFLGLTWARRGWRHRHSQLQPPRPSHLLFSLPTTPSYSPSPSSTLFKLLLVLLVLCAVALLLFHFTPLSLIVCHHMSEVEYTTKAECFPVTHLLQRPLLL